MGIFDAFSREARTNRAVARNIKKLTNKWIHMDERRASISNLRALGTDDAIAGLLLRFGFVIDNTTVDEEEKSRVAEALNDLGERSVPHLLNYLRSSEAMTWPLKVLTQIEEPGKVADQLLEILNDIDPLEKRAGQRRIQLVLQLAELQDPRIVDALLPLLLDDNEDVQFHSIEALEGLADERARGPLLDMAIDEDSIRLRSRALEALSRCEWSVADRREEIAPLLPSNHYLDRQGVIQNRIGEIVTGLQADDPRLRRFAARDATALDKPEEAVELLAAALSDPDASVRLAVAAALGKVGDFRAIGPLEAALEDPDRDVRRKVEDALRRVRNTSENQGF